MSILYRHSLPIARLSIISPSTEPGIVPGMLWHNLSSQPTNHPGCLLSLDLGALFDLGAIVGKCRAVYSITYGAGDSPG